MKKLIKKPASISANSLTLPDFPVAQIRGQFPILETEIGGQKLLYLDSAATTLRPNVVLEEMQNCYQNYNLSFGRSSGGLASFAENEHEKARIKIAQFLGLKSSEELIFTSGATDSLNLLAQSLACSLSLGRLNWPVGGEILVTEMEHHSNFLPWQILARKLDLKLKFWPVLESGNLDLNQTKELINEQTCLLALTQTSNLLGITNPVAEIAKLAKEINPEILVVVDTSQSLPHFPLNLPEMNCDFLAFSGHKMYGPSGIGLLWGKKSLLEKLDPARIGGGSVTEVDKNGFEYASLPEKWQAGTGNLPGVVGLAAAVDFLQEMRILGCEKYEQDLVAYTREKLATISNLHFASNQKNQVDLQQNSQVPILSFFIQNISSFDLAQALGQRNIILRAGAFCCQPLLQALDLPPLLRISLSFYNTKEEIDLFVKELKNSLQLFC